MEYTGDGVMALFGAPVALEDHAFRACLAALAIQEEASRLAAEVQRRDGVALRLRVGLNSGRVIAGELGSGSLGYAATGQAVGFAQRMESAAPPGAVMLSESTSRLVEHTVMLAEPEWVHIKGADEPVRARRLLAIGPREGLIGRAEAALVGRRWEMAALDALLDRTIGGRGGVVNVVGPPGIGKSRVGARDRRAGNRARRRGVLDLLRVPRQRHPLPGGGAAAAGEHRRGRPCRPRRPGAGHENEYRMPTRRICCCSMICSASPTPTWRCPRSTGMRGGAG